MPVSEPPPEPPKHTHQLEHNHPAAYDPRQESKKLPRGPKRWLHRCKEWYGHLSKKQKIIFWSVIAGLIIASALIWWFVFARAEPPPPKPKPVKKAQPPPKPTTVASRLTGVQVKPALGKLPTTGIMIENSPDARPQSGLYDAGVIFEAIAEGGITRFLALYLESRPDYVGPVRSLRPYYLDFVGPFDAGIAHAGGSGQALAEVANEGFRDIEAFRYPDYFQRVSTRFAPHNLFTNRAGLVDLQKKLGWGKSTFKGFDRLAKEGKPATPAKAQAIDLNISGPTYDVHYDYDKNTNSYLRSMGGQPHIDEKANKQILPKVVIALVMTHHYSGVYSVYGTTGSGQMKVFQNGKVIPGTWHKAGRKEQFVFKNAAGKTLKLNPGQTWITVVSSPEAITHQPAAAPKPNAQ